MWLVVCWWMQLFVIFDCKLCCHAFFPERCPAARASILRCLGMCRHQLTRSNAPWIKDKWKIKTFVIGFSLWASTDRNELEWVWINAASGCLCPGLHPEVAQCSSGSLPLEPHQVSLRPGVKACQQNLLYCISLSLLHCSITLCLTDLTQRGTNTQIKTVFVKLSYYIKRRVSKNGLKTSQLIQNLVSFVSKRTKILEEERIPLKRQNIKIVSCCLLD